MLKVFRASRLFCFWQ